MEDRDTRRLNLLIKRMGFFGPTPDNVTIRRAITADELLGALRIVHDLFVQETYIPPMPGRVRLRAFDADINTATFIAVANGDIVGVISVVIDSPLLGLPCDRAFRQENDVFRAMGRKLCEGTNWCITPAYRRTAVMTDLFRCCYAYAVWAGMSDFIAEVNPEHAGFYETISFERVGIDKDSLQNRNKVDWVTLLCHPIAEVQAQAKALPAGDFSPLARVIRDYMMRHHQHTSKMALWRWRALQEFRNPQFVKRVFHLLLKDPSQGKIVKDLIGRYTEQ